MADPIASTAALAGNSTTNGMPVWNEGKTSIDVDWLKESTKLPVTQCLSVADVSNETRRGATVSEGATLKMLLELDDEGNNKRQLSVIVKQVPERGRPLSQQLGLAREALFYAHFGKEVEAASSATTAAASTTEQRIMIPKIYYAWGDMTSGAKVIIMEDLSQVSIDSGALFGNGNPNNWNRDLEAIVARLGDVRPTAAHVARVTFVEIARIQATFWCRPDVLNSAASHWLRGHAWLLGRDKASWEASQQLVRSFWQVNVNHEETTKQTLIDWDPLVRRAVEKAIAGISWDAQQQRLNPNGRWTLVHGDFWPGNAMWLINNSNQHDDDLSIRLLDWEMVGVGSGPQDLGQYVISNMDPNERKACEKDLVQAYFNELKRMGVDNVDWEYCWQEYIVGGLERWLWFLVYFVGQGGGMAAWAQFFHNQMAAFMHDHNVTADDIVQPRP